ncbi:hypothetical protein V5F77_10160 [Xanthobacter sp. DSM 24535]|uniref:hypothetical protein n=1 Tax=Roseixanthobacter psychrophilus TaxID=3119917 RepID=UPI00372675FD
MTKIAVQNLLATVLDTVGARAPGVRASVPHLGLSESDRSGDARKEPTFRITALCAPDMVEIEDAHAVRQRVVLSFGAREMLDIAMKRECRESPVGLRIRREAFEVEGVAFSRWSLAD